MSFSSVIERDFALKDMELMKEFDMSSFISNAKASINNTFNGVKITPVKFETYVNMLTTVTNDFVAKASIDTDRFDNFKDMVNQMDDSLNMKVPMITESDVITIKPAYISQMVDTAKNMIQKFIQNTMSESEIAMFNYGEFALKVKKQAVVTTIPYMTTTKSIINLESNDQASMDLTKNNMLTKVLPFVTNFKNNKFVVLKETSKLAEVITSASDDISIITTTVNNTIPNLDAKKAQALSQFVYNLYKSILDVVSFTTMCTVRKLNTLSANIVKCETIYNVVRSTSMSSVIESVIDADLIPTDIDTVADDIMHGRVDVFSTIASSVYDSIMNCSVGNPFSKIDPELSGSVDSMIQKAEYSKVPYEDTAKIFISIKTGLEIIVQNSDDITISFEDLMQKSGFTMDINDHYRSNLSSIDDLSAYNSVELAPTDDLNMLMAMMHEVSDYGENMKALSDSISDVFNLIDEIKDRYTKNINNDLKNTELVNEIKVFLNTLIEQYKRLSATVSTKFMDRLKAISFILEKKCGTDSDGNITTTEEETIDFVDMALESCIEDLENNIACIFEQMQEEYFTLKYEAMTGSRPVFEADGDQNNQQNTNNQNQQQNNQQQNGNNNSTKVSVTDGQNGAGTAKKVVQSIARFLNQLIQKFLGWIKKNGGRNKKFFDENGEYLKTRKYVNCSVNILPYVAQAATVRDISNVISFINGLTPQALQQLNSKEDAYRKVIPMVSNLKIDDKKQTTDAITKYFKVGNAQLNTITKKDGELTELMNTVVTESLDYWGNNPTITGKLNELSKACENKEKTLGLNVDQSNNDQNNTNTNNVTESVNIIYLEDGDQQNNQNGNQDQSNLAEKYGWVSEAVRVFVGCLMNAIRDKYNDYYTLAYQFAQANIKNKNTDQKNNQNNNNTPNNNQTENQNQNNQSEQK